MDIETAATLAALRADLVRAQERIGHLERNVPAPTTGRIVTYVTGLLADGETELGEMPLGISFIIVRFSSSGGCRVRMYQSDGHRAADAARPVGVTPTGDHGQIFEDDGAPPLQYATVAPGALLAGVSRVPVAFTNRSGATAAFTIEIEVRT